MSWPRLATLLLIGLAGGLSVGATPEARDAPVAPALRALAPARAVRLHLGQLAGSLVPSPNGRYIAAVHEYPLPDTEGALPVGIRLYNAEGDFLQDLTFGKFYRVDEMAWSPGGQALYFRADPSLESHPGDGGVWKCDLSSGTIYRPRLAGLIPTELEPDFSPIEQGRLPIWSPLGDSYLVQDTQRLAKDAYHQMIYRVDFGTGKKRLLTEGYGPVWSPDGQQIAFIKSRFQDGRSLTDWWVVGRDGSGEHPVLTDHDLDLQARLHAQDATVAGIPAAWLGATGMLLIGGSLLKETPPEARTGIWRVGHTLDWVPLPKLNLIAAAADGKHFYFETCPKPGTFITYCVTRQETR